MIDVKVKYIKKNNFISHYIDVIKNNITIDHFYLTRDEYVIFNKIISDEKYALLYYKHEYLSPIAYFKLNNKQETFNITIEKIKLKKYETLL